MQVHTAVFEDRHGHAKSEWHERRVFFFGVREFSAPSSYCLCLSPLSPWLLTPTLLLTPGIQHEKAIESDSATYGYLQPSTVHLEMVRLANILLKAKPDEEMLHILDIGSGISQASAR